MTKEGKIALITSHLMGASETEIDDILESVAADGGPIAWSDLSSDQQASLRRGMADAESGRTTPAGDVFQRLYRKINRANPHADDA